MTTKLDKKILTDQTENLLARVKALAVEITETDEASQEKLAEIETEANKNIAEIKNIIDQIDQKEQETMTELDKLISEQIKNLTDQE